MAAGFRRDSLDTRVPEEGYELEEFEESDECQWFDDGVGGVAQAICTVHARVQCGDCSQVLSMAVVLHSKSNLHVAAMQCLICRHQAARSASRPIFRVFRLSSPRYLHLLLDGPRHLHSTCCSRPIPRMIQRCRHCAVRHLVDEDGASSDSLFCGQLSIFGSDLGFKSKAFPNLEIKSRKCGQNMSVAVLVVACSNRLESVE